MTTGHIFEVKPLISLKTTDSILNSIPDESEMVLIGEISSNQ